MTYHKMDAERRLNLLNSIRSDLSGRGYIIFAYLFGSFNDYDEAVGFRDIDIALYMSEVEDPLSEALSIGVELSSKYNLPIDCLPLNYAPLSLGYRIFRDGTALFCKDEVLRDAIIEDTVTEVLDFMPLREGAIRELV
ncbi:MAG: nucleotidyltransferase domain-containing protein [Nitrospirae bacterium]|nr:nucleotidyltransferase domain-containing protein [Nitrospirota bacterium]